MMKKFPGFRKFLLTFIGDQLKMQHIKSQTGQYGIYLIFAVQAA